ncbi:MAG TPA: hypothetical protein VK444_08065 [Methanobacteriaceae archaeon]|nr:hypothetical protein [Methanobacteriaceae archaeon]
MLVDLCGDYPQVKVLDLLLSQPWQEFTKTDLARSGNVSRSTIYQVVDNLESHDILIPTRKIANTQLYRLNQNSPPVKILMQLVADLVEGNSLAIKEDEQDPKNPKNDKQTLNQDYHELNGDKLKSSEKQTKELQNESKSGKEITESYQTLLF